MLYALYDNLGSQMTTLSVRIPDEIDTRLEKLVKATGRTRSYLAVDALQRYLEQEEWQTQAIKRAVERADRGEARYASHDAVDAWLSTWGTESERDAPECE
jgi:RHH-type rel operon transcriptional repressor/antitoxin RelB